METNMVDAFAVLTILSAVFLLSFLAITVPELIQKIESEICFSQNM